MRQYARFFALRCFAQGASGSAILKGVEYDVVSPFPRADPAFPEDLIKVRVVAGNEFGSNPFLRVDRGRYALESEDSWGIQGKSETKRKNLCDSCFLGLSASRESHSGLFVKREDNGFRL